ncbi:MAG: hypothetical protein QOC92_1270, partial [Acidimicrobiaceae bacterium]
MADELIVRRYSVTDRQAWDDFVRGSRNGTFLFERDYLDYHADRFPDASLLVECGGELRTILPATMRDDALISHAGLTYGGFVVDGWMTADRMLKALGAVLRHAADSGAARLIYKTIPHIYHRQPAEEDRYALFRAAARLTRSDLLTVIDCTERGPVQERRLRSLKRARAAGVEAALTCDFASFWPLVIENLTERYGLKPVHSLEEIELLANRFPERILLCTATVDGAVAAGAVVYVSDRVCHVQYSATNAAGRRANALDVVLERLYEWVAQRVRYFDFGVSTEANGDYLNSGLVQYKESFGGRSVVHD